jgi:multisubunit Na+/H+ antiporter MnhF subunit
MIVPNAELLVACGATTVAAVVFLIAKGDSAVARWVGCEFLLACGAGCWVVFGVCTGQRFWIECAIVSQLVGLVIPIWWKFCR